MNKTSLHGKVIAICQPNFLPWLGYFEMALRADIFVMLDDVQYTKNEWINRNRILSHSVQGWQWLTVPLQKKKLESLINEMEIKNDPNWNEGMLKTIHHVYNKAPYYVQHSGSLKAILSQKWDRLIDLNLALIRLIYEILGIKNKLILSSELDISSRKDDKPAQICEKLEAGVYLANNGSKSYIDPSKFHQKNIGFIFQDYTHPVYTAGQYNFIPYLSVMDLIFWYGPEALNIILKGRKSNWESEISYS